MPSYDDAILYVNASDVPIDDAVFHALRGEQCMLVQSCVCTPEQGAPEVRTRPDGKSFLTVYPPATLTWALRARVAELSGLANYHPGVALSRQGLSFANGPEWRWPFQFEEDGTLVLERPVLSPEPGSLPTFEFAIRMVNGGGLDATEHPASGGGGTVTLYADITAAAAAVEVTSTMGNTLLLEVFEGADAFAGEPVLATLYNGDPAGAGTAVTGGVEMEAWSDIRDRVSGYGGEAWNPLTVWTGDTSTAERRATHLRLSRNGAVIRDIALPVELVIPAYFTPRLPAAAVGVWLSWPADGSALATNPGMEIIEFLMGGSRSTLLPNANRTLRAWDGDPNNGGTELDDIALTAGGAQFNVSAITVNPGSVTGGTNAPGGGWAVEYITIEVTSTGLIVFKQQHTLSVTAGNVITLSNEPEMDLGAV